MSQLDNYKLWRIRRKLDKSLNRRELIALGESIIADVSYRCGNPDKQKAAISYMKIAHGKNFDVGAWKNN